MQPIVRLAAVILFVVVSMAKSTAKADFETDYALSLEWLVDSSDEIHHVRILQSTGQVGGTACQSLEIVKEFDSNTQSLAKKDFSKLNGLFSARQGDEVLLFVRYVDDRRTRVVFRSMNLTQPSSHYRTAAITKAGQVLPSRDEIMSAIEARMRLARRLPDQCERFRIDKLARRSQNKSTEYLNQKLPYESHLIDLLGGRVISITCNYWDGDGPVSHGIYIDQLIVPIEPEDRTTCIELARGGQSDKKTSIYNPIKFLVNFPDKETVTFLEQIVDSPTDAESPATSNEFHRIDDILDRKRKAREVLKFFHFNQPALDPLNDQLVGHWRLIGWEKEGEYLDMILAADRSMTVDYYRPSEQADAPAELMWRGRGVWVVRDGILSLLRTHIFMHERWRHYHRWLQEKKRIDTAGEHFVQLDGRLFLERVEEESR